jgi:glutaredoxin 3
VKHSIEIYSAGCATCQTTIEMVKKLAGAEHEVQVRDMQQRDVASQASEYGIRSLPAVVIDGKLASCCAERGPDENTLRAALR